MTKQLFLMTLLMAGMLAGCASGEKKSAELLETAAFEEKQNNFEHASSLYADILKNYPDSAAAKTAMARLQELKNRKP